MAIGTVSALMTLFNFSPTWRLGCLCFAVLFGGLGLPIVLTLLIAQVRVDAEKLTCRNAIGISRSVYWPDIQCAYTTSIQGNIKICGKYGNLRIGSEYAGFNHLKALIEQAHPGAFSPESVLESKAFKVAEGIAAFRQAMGIINVGIFMVLLGSIVFLPLPAADTIENLIAKILLFVGFGTWGFYFILDGLVSRVYLEPERLVYRNFYGGKIAIDWRDIRKVRACVTRDRSKREYVLVSGNEIQIKIKRNYIAYDLLKSEIKKRREESMV